MFENIGSDIERLREIKSKPWPWFIIESLAFENGFQAVLCYRLASWFRRNGIPVLGPLFSRLGLFCTGADISPAAVIGPGFRIAHGVGLVVGGGVRIGSGALLLHGVTLGARSQKRIDEMPELGDRVFVGAHASVFGPVRIGNDVFIAAGTTVTCDVPDHCKVVAPRSLEILIQPADASMARDGAEKPGAALPRERGPGG